MPVTIARTAWTDDDGTGQTGTVINNNVKTSLYDQIDAALLAFGGTSTGSTGMVLHGPSTAAQYAPVVEAVLSLSDNVTNNASTGRHGFVPKLSGSASEFFSGAGTFAAAGEPTEQTTTNTGTQNDFNLTASFTFLRCTGADPVFTGFTVAGAAPTAGDRVLIACLGTTVKVANQDAGSTAANRVICPSTAGQIVGVNGLMLLIYDDTTDRWREQVIDPGAWIVPTFAAGDYTGNGSMTWTVESGDVTNVSYQQRGNTLTMTAYIDTTTVGGTPSTLLQIAIPGGMTGKRASLNQVLYYSDNGTKGVGFVDVAASGAVIRLAKTDVSNWTAATNNTSVYTTVTIEIN